MKRIFIGLFISYLCVSSFTQLYGQQVFKGSLAYERTFSGKQDDLPRRFAKDDKGVIITKHKMFRVSVVAKGQTKDYLFETGKEIGYIIDRTMKTITKDAFGTELSEKRRGRERARVTLKKTNQDTIIAGERVQATDVFTDKDKVARIWISDKYIWSLSAHPYEIKHPLLGISMIFCDCRVILGLRVYSKKGKVSYNVTKMSKKVAKNAFKLPKKFRLIDKTVEPEPLPPVKLDTKN